MDSLHAVRDRLGTESNIVETPIIVNDEINTWFSDLIGQPIEIMFKSENLQTSGSFNYRGASAFIIGRQHTGVVVASSGNYAKSLAISAREHSIPVCAVISDSALESKVKAVEELGAEIIRCPNEDRDKVAEKERAKRGYCLGHPSNSPDSIAGAATLGLELREQLGKVDCCIATCGGGALLAGLCHGYKGGPNGAKFVVGAEPLVKEKEPTNIDALSPLGATICDGLTRSMSMETFDVISKKCDKLIKVPDEDTKRANLALMKFLGYIIEPSAAVAFAALLQPEMIQYCKDKYIRRILIVISGGNTTVFELAKLLNGSESFM